MDRATIRTDLARRLVETLAHYSRMNEHLRHRSGLPDDWPERAALLADDHLAKPRSRSFQARVRLHQIGATPFFSRKCPTASTRGQAGCLDTKRRSEIIGVKPVVNRVHELALRTMVR